jgi:NAD(P)-dependent dehydrogenase (short-subunit alcohol dehydrogenase family)
VLVTGGARGLGLAIATALLESNAEVVYCLDVLPSPDKAEWAKAEEVIKKNGKQQRIEYRQLNITDEQAVEETLKGIYDNESTPLSRFFGAAGVQQMLPAVDFPAKDFRRILDINVTGELSLDAN